jgi:hypothetical protein
MILHVVTALSDHVQVTAAIARALVTGTGVFWLLTFLLKMNQHKHKFCISCPAFTLKSTMFHSSVYCSFTWCSCQGIFFKKFHLHSFHDAHSAKLSHISSAVQEDRFHKWTETISGQSVIINDKGMKMCLFLPDHYQQQSDSYSASCMRNSYFHTPRDIIIWYLRSWQTPVLLAKPQDWEALL